MKTVKLTNSEIKYIHLLLRTDLSRVDDVTLEQRRLNDSLRDKL